MICPCLHPQLQLRSREHPHHRVASSPARSPARVHPRVDSLHPQPRWSRSGGRTEPSRLGSPHQHTPLHHRHVPALRGPRPAKHTWPVPLAIWSPTWPFRGSPRSHQSLFSPMKPTPGELGHQLSHTTSTPPLPPIETSQQAKLSHLRSVGFSWKLFHRDTPSLPPHSRGVEQCNPLQVPAPSPLPGLGSRRGTCTLYKLCLCGHRPSLARLSQRLFLPELVSAISSEHFRDTCSRGAFRLRLMRHACCDRAVCTCTNRMHTHAHIHVHAHNAHAHTHPYMHTHGLIHHAHNTHAHPSTHSPQEAASMTPQKKRFMPPKWLQKAGEVEG